MQKENNVVKAKVYVFLSTLDSHPGVCSFISASMSRSYKKGSFIKKKECSRISS